MGITSKTKLLVRKFMRHVVQPDPHDAMAQCAVYIKDGCSHVNGYLCNMNTCSILNKYKETKNEITKI